MEFPPETRPKTVRGDVLKRYLEVRALTTELASTLTPEDCVIQSMADASPVGWHLAHTTWFFETFVLAKASALHRAFDPLFNFLFNSYYDSIGPQHPRSARGLLSRPSLAQIHEYRRCVDGAMERLLDRQDFALDEGLAQALTLGLNHEQQHQELLLTDVKHLFSRNPIVPRYAEGEVIRRPSVPCRWLAHEGGLEAIGHASPEFAYDNEGPRHRIFLERFEIASRPVTNGEFLVFMEDGGYRRPELWLSDGWQRVIEEGWSAPLYWSRSREPIETFTLRGMAELDPSAPVCHVSWYEADAYARWIGARLPTEAEWEVIAARLPVTGNTLDRGLLHPVAPEAASGNGPQQVFGDVWEWTASPFVAYPGYVRPLGPFGEYNGKFMCNQFVLRGGSCVTPGNHLRPTYRNFFPPTARWQFSGIRLARS